MATIALLLAVAGCDGARPPTAAAPIPSSPTAPIPPLTVAYRLSGRVTDHTGAPIANASVEAGFSIAGSNLGSYVLTRTGAGGDYQLEYRASGPLHNVPGASARMIVFVAGSQTHQQYLPWDVTDVVRNVRLHPVQQVEAGGSLTATIESDHSICSDQEDWLIPDQQCEQFEVLVRSAGTLTVSARAVDDGGPETVVFSATSGWYGGQINRPGTVSLVQVRAGERYRLFVGIPVGTTPRRVAVSTSLQP